MNLNLSKEQVEAFVENIKNHKCLLSTIVLSHALNNKNANKYNHRIQELTELASKCTPVQMTEAEYKSLLSMPDQIQLGLAKFIPESEVKKVNSTVSTKSASPTQALTEFNTKAIEQILSNISFKLDNQAPSVESVREKLADALVTEFKKSQKSGKEINLGRKMHLANLEKKALGIGGPEGAAFGIDELLTQEVVSRFDNDAYITSGLLQSPRSSVQSRSLSIQSLPNAVKDVENIAGIPKAATGGLTLRQAANQVAKTLVKETITDEFIKDASNIEVLDFFVQQCLVTLNQYVELQVLYGDGTPDNMRGILNYRISDTESVKNDHERDVDFFAMTTASSNSDDDVAAGVLSTLGSVKGGVARNAYMSPTTSAFLRGLRSTNGEQLLNFEGDKLENFNIILCDFMPDPVADATPIIFGDMMKSINVSLNIHQMIIDEYTVDGSTEVTIRANIDESVRDNTSIRIFKMSA